MYLSAIPDPGQVWRRDLWEYRPISLSMLPDPKHVGMSLLSSIRAEIYVISSVVLFLRRYLAKSHTCMYFTNCKAYFGHLGFVV